MVLALLTELTWDEMASDPHTVEVVLKPDPLESKDISKPGEKGSTVKSNTNTCLQCFHMEMNPNQGYIVQGKLSMLCVRGERQTRLYRPALVKSTRKFNYK